MVKYIGSKRTLVPLIAALAESLPVSSACDLFAGTTRVGQGLRRAGLHVHSNDLATYSEALGRAYIEAGPAERAQAAGLLAQLGALPGRAGYFTSTFCREARYFQVRNGERVDAIRNAIEALSQALSLDPVVRGLLLTSLMEAADRVDSTTGLQMAYLKRWAPRAWGELELRPPAAVDGPRGLVTRMDANALASSVEAELVYLDPPYNQHSYFSNYHIWETLVRWDAPEAYGVARKRTDCRERKSPYNSKVAARGALDELLGRLRAPWMIVSFNDEGFHDPRHVVSLLGEHGYVGFLEVDFKRYVGAQIGIHNPDGEKVGSVSHLRNKELLFLVGPDAVRVRQALERVSGLASSLGLDRGEPRRRASAPRRPPARPPVQAPPSPARAARRDAAA